MKEFAIVGTVFAKYCGVDLLSSLFRVAPEGQNWPNRPPEQQSFRVKLLISDPRLKILLEILARSKMIPWDATHPLNWQREFPYELERIYEPADFAEVELLEMVPEPFVPNHERTEDGVLKLGVRTLKPSADFARSQMGTPAAVVPDRVRSVLSKGQFKHLEFRPTVLIDRSRSLDKILPWKDRERWWELHSTLILPRLSPRLKLQDANGMDFVGDDFSKGCAPVEGFYDTPELRYRRGDLPDLKSFDFAFTYERFGPRPKPEDRTPIVSKRFYDFCIKHSLECRWVPVRIDNE